MINKLRNWFASKTGEKNVPDNSSTSNAQAKAGENSNERPSIPQPRPQSDTDFRTARIEKLCELCREEISVCEVGTTNRGERVDWYQQATWLDEKYWGAWCAAFVCRMIWELVKIYPTNRFNRPQTAGAWDFENWAKNNSLPLIDGSAKIKKGDIVIYNFHHIGIAVSDESINGNFNVIEGNTNNDGSRDGRFVLLQLRNRRIVKTIIRLMF